MGIGTEKTWRLSSEVQGLLGSPHVYKIEPRARENAASTASGTYRRPFQFPLLVFLYLIEFERWIRRIKP